MLQANLQIAKFKIILCLFNVPNISERICVSVKTENKNKINFLIS